MSNEIIVKIQASRDSGSKDFAKARKQRGRAHCVSVQTDTIRENRFSADPNGRSSFPVTRLPCGGVASCLYSLGFTFFREAAAHEWTVIVCPGFSIRGIFIRTVAKYASAVHASYV